MCKELIAQWEAVTLIKIFETKVINLETKEEDWITFNISHNDDMIYACASEELEIESVEWDDCFSLDEHLQSLHELCTNAIMESDKWEEVCE